MFGMVRVPIAVFIWPCISLAGARIDIRPDVPGPYEPGQTVHFAAHLVDTGNLWGDIFFRSLELDFTDSSPELVYPGLDNLPGTSDDNMFVWTEPFLGIHALFPGLPRPLLVWPLPNCPQGSPLAVWLPDDGERHLGAISVTMPSTPGNYVIDVMNDDASDSDLGARAHFGCGGPPPWPPDTIWRAHTGELTGGVFEITVVPEPGTLLSLLLVVLGLRGRFLSK